MIIEHLINILLLYGNNMDVSIYYNSIKNQWDQRKLILHFPL